MAEHAISVHGLEKGIGQRTLFSDLSFGLETGAKAGLIGDNGAGKSTLLRIMAGQLSADAGKVMPRRGLRIRMLEQEPELAPGTIGDNLRAEFAELVETIAAYEKAAMDPDGKSEDLLDRIETLGGWDYQHRLDIAASRVGLQDYDRDVESLSGGERKRVALAKILVSEPDLLLLDEPTNHLDADTVTWLEQWLQSFSGTVLVVTHDRYFLDRVVDRMLALGAGGLRTYMGNYTDYITSRALEEAQQKVLHKRRLRHLMQEMAWAKKSPSARSTKQKARLERIDDVEDQVEQLAQTRFVAEFDFGGAPRLGKTILELREVGFAYPGGDSELIHNCTLTLKAGERIGIVGQNGAGKSTLLRLILDELQPLHGEIIRGKNTEAAVFDQHRTLIEEGKTVMQTILPEGGDRVFPGGSGDGLHVASWLERFGFRTDDHRRPVDTLSGGERSRLALSCFLLTPANLLMLDEPTNDLDITTLNVLEEALMRFKGCILVVSHDRYFLDKIATGTLAFEAVPGGPAKIDYRHGGYTRYAEAKALDEARRAQNDGSPPSGAGTKKAKGAKSTKKKKKMSFKQQQELDGMEAAIEAAEAGVADLEAKVADPELWAQGGGDGPAVQAKLDAAIAQKDRLYGRWEELTELKAAVD